MKKLLVAFFISASAFGSEYSDFVDQYFENYFRTHPAEATGIGIHTYDSEVPDFSRKVIQSRAAQLKSDLKSLDKISNEGLAALDIRDKKMIRNHIQGQLLELEEIPMWQTDPDFYPSAVSSLVYVIMSRKFDSSTARLKLLVEREKKALKILEQGKANLTRPPKVFTEVALQQLPGTIAFFKKDVPLAFNDVTDQKLKAEFEKSNTALISAFESYEKFLRVKILPRSDGSYRLGSARFKKKLLYEEMVDMPLEQLLKVGMADLRKNQAAYVETAKKIDAKKSVSQIVAEMAKDHPEPSELLPTVRKQTELAREFILKKDILTIPGSTLPIIQETPPFLRALTFASMDIPGAFETVAKEAYYNITGPEPEMKGAELEEYMSEFTYGVTLATSVHEAYPGHYTQFLWAPQAPSKVRKILGTNTNVEGWAHYCEQMMLDEGFGGNDPRIRLGQLKDALLRNARFVVAIRMHTGNMTFDEAVDFFVKEGYQSRAGAEKETKRGTSDATYLYYTLGKLQILKLREDYRALKGKDYSLKKFHDAFLSRGYPPLQIVREELLGKVGSML